MHPCLAEGEQEGVLVMILLNYQLSLHTKCSPGEFINMTRALVRVWDGVSSLYDMAQRDLKVELVESALKEVGTSYCHGGMH